MKAIIGEKLGMTQVFDDENRATPVTVIKAGPVRVTQIKREDRDGYAAVQIAFKEMSAAKAGRPLASVERLWPEADVPSPDGQPPLKLAWLHVP